ncbi:hypothetical protein C7999DRAFT_39655 [Corynascus novoguineensis]|uniref:Uncharacterized protein n=1 Tax=Corynascus novoguineensis TaxID=1126955 RepID=A0AAN7CVM1_9PEZI|nr:hypothetical protein C7999DRAFT_39655 [Corynascus novoguineensis]
MTLERAISAFIFRRHRIYDKRCIEHIPDDQIALFSKRESLNKDSLLSDRGDDDDTITLYTNDDESVQSIQDIASKVAYLLWRAEHEDDALQNNVAEVTSCHPWNRKMAEHCLYHVIQYVGQGRDEMGHAMRKTLDRVTDIADEEFMFPRNHPESVYGFVAIVSAGVLAELQGTWVLELLGFGDFTGKKKATRTEQVVLLPSDRLLSFNGPEMSSFAVQ